MSRRIPVQIYFAPEHAALIRNAAAADGISISSWVRQATLRAVARETGDRADRSERDLTFAITALDALLAAHPVPDLRARAYQTYGRKIDERALRRPLLAGGGQ